MFEVFDSLTGETVTFCQSEYLARYLCQVVDSNSGVTACDYDDAPYGPHFPIYF